MIMKDKKDQLAFDYALGILEQSEHADVEEARRTDTDLDNRISYWELRLAPLLETVESIPPDRDMVAKIEAQILEQENSANREKVEDNIIDLTSRLKRWRVAALSASAIAASLFAFIVFNPLAGDETRHQYFAVFNPDDLSPSFTLTINIKTRELIIRPVNAAAQPDKVYQLWIASDELGPGPHSLGLLQPVSQHTRKKLDQFKPQLLKKALFGISLEPKGGSPTGKPTSPAIHGTLMPTSL